MKRQDEPRIQYIFDRFPWLTRARAVAGAFGITLLVVFIWPHARLVTLGDALVELGERGAGVKYFKEAVDN